MINNNNNNNAEIANFSAIKNCLSEFNMFLCPLLAQLGFREPRQ